MGGLEGGVGLKKYYLSQGEFKKLNDKVRLIGAHFAHY